VCETTRMRSALPSSRLHCQCNVPEYRETRYFESIVERLLVRKKGRLFPGYALPADIHVLRSEYNPRCFLDVLSRRAAKQWISPYPNATYKSPSNPYPRREDRRICSRIKIYRSIIVDRDASKLIRNRSGQQHTLLNYLLRSTIAVSFARGRVFLPCDDRESGKVSRAEKNCSYLAPASSFALKGRRDSTRLSPPFPSPHRSVEARLSASLRFKWSLLATIAP
jgi:hypothetical protein